MNFGSLQIATLWRLSKAGVTCDGLVVDGVKELRLIITEGGHIVHWERFPTAGLLRRRALTILRSRRKSGWRVAGIPAEERGTPAFVASTSSKRGTSRLVQGTLGAGGTRMAADLES